MVETIITQYSGSAARGPESISGDAEHMRIVVVRDDGSQEELFRGSKFSEEKFREDMERLSMTSELK
jgi:hypothetical protein